MVRYAQRKDKKVIELQRDDQILSFQVIRSQRKSIGLQVQTNEKIILRVPAWLSDQKILEFVKAEQEWIWNKTKQMLINIERQKNTGATPFEHLSEDEIEKIKEKISNRVYDYCKIMRVTIGKITIRNQKTRWGSCSSKGNLNFNYQLYYLPDYLLNYVIIHELAHRRYMNHSEEFWNEVAIYCPDYKKRRKDLKEYQLV